MPREYFDKQVKLPRLGCIPTCFWVAESMNVKIVDADFMNGRSQGRLSRLLKKVFWSRSAGKIFLYAAISCRQRGITNRSQKVFPLSGGMIWSTLSFSAAC